IFELELKKIRGEAKKKLGKEEFEFFIENYDLEVSEDVVIRQINNNLQSAFIWANEVNFSTALASKELNKIFVDIDLFLAPLKTRFDVDEEMDKINSKDLLSNFTRNKIIYGGAGAGKT